MPRDARRPAIDAGGEIRRQNPGLNRKCFEQRGLDGRPGFGGGEPHLVGETGFDIVAELLGESVGRRGVKIRFVFDGDQAVDPVGIGGDPPDLDAVARRACLDDPTVGRAVDGLPDVSPRIVGFGQRVAVPRPLRGCIANDVQKVGIEFILAEGGAGGEGLRVSFDDNGISA